MFIVSIRLFQIFYYFRAIGGELGLTSWLNIALDNEYACIYLA